MQAMQGMDFGNFPDMHSVIINTNHPLVATKMLKMRSAEKKAKFAEYLYMLAKVNQKMLTGEDMSTFMERSIEFLQDN